MRTALVFLTTLALLAGCGGDDDAQKQQRITELKAQESSLSAQWEAAHDKTRELSLAVIPAHNALKAAKRNEENVDAAKAAYDEAQQVYNEALKDDQNAKRKLLSLTSRGVAERSATMGTMPSLVNERRSSAERMQKMTVSS